MEYTIDNLPDGTTYERFEGTPEEIAELIRLMERSPGFETEDEYWDYMNETYLDEED